MKIKLDDRHSKSGHTLFCKVSSSDIKQDSLITVNMDALLANINSLKKIIFEIDDTALEWIAAELHIEPEDELTLPLDENPLESLKVNQDMVGSSYYLIPIYRISGFTECFVEEPKEKSLFSFDDE